MNNESHNPLLSVHPQPWYIKQQILQYLLTPSQKIFYNCWHLLSERQFQESIHSQNTVIEMDYFLRGRSTSRSRRNQFLSPCLTTLRWRRYLQTGISPDSPLPSWDTHSLDSCPHQNRTFVEQRRPTLTVLQIKEYLYRFPKENEVWIQRLYHSSYHAVKLFILYLYFQWSGTVSFDYCYPLLQWKRLFNQRCPLTTTPFHCPPSKYIYSCLVWDTPIQHLSTLVNPISMMDHFPLELPGKQWEKFFHFLMEKGIYLNRTERSFMIQKIIANDFLSEEERKSLFTRYFPQEMYRYVEHLALHSMFAEELITEQNRCLMALRDRCYLEVNPLTFSYFQGMKAKIRYAFYHLLPPESIGLVPGREYHTLLKFNRSSLESTLFLSLSSNLHNALSQSVTEHEKILVLETMSYRWDTHTIRSTLRHLQETTLFSPGPSASLWLSRYIWDAKWCELIIPYLQKGGTLPMEDLYYFQVHDFHYLLSQVAPPGWKEKGRYSPRSDLLAIYSRINYTGYEKSQAKVKLLLHSLTNSPLSRMVQSDFLDALKWDDLHPETMIDVFEVSLTRGWYYNVCCLFQHPVTRYDYPIRGYLNCKWAEHLPRLLTLKENRPPVQKIEKEVLDFVGSSKLKLIFTSQFFTIHSKKI